MIVGQERLDPRVARTRRLLQDALMDLAKERSLDDISIADIADAATVNRTTFYQHYPDKETLLADALDEHAARNGADLGGLEAQFHDRHRPPLVLVHYLRHIAENSDVYRVALGGHGSSIAQTRLRERITQIAMEGIRMYGPSPAWLPMPAEVAAASIAGSIIGVLRAWLERESLAPPDEAAEWLWLALAGALPAEGGA